MKTTRAALLAAVGALIVSVGGAFAAPGTSRGGGHGETKKVVVKGKVVSVSEGGVSFVIHRSGGRGSRRAGSDVTVFPNLYTVFKRSDGAEFSPEDLAVGVKAQAKGKLDREGNLLATQVLIKVESESEE